MRGGVHESLKVYVIQKILGEPKCFVIKKARRGFRDDIYLFFNATLPQDEINEFVCAAMGLESTVRIEPALDIKRSYKGEVFNNLFIRLGGFNSYSIESGLLSNSEIISEGSFTKHTISGNHTKMETWDDVIKKLEEKSNSKEGYTFTPIDDKYVMNRGEITTSDLNLLFKVIIKITMFKIQEDCKGKQILHDIQKLYTLIETQLRITAGMDKYSRIFAVGNSKIKDKEKDKQHNISETRKHFPTWDADISKASDLIAQIKGNQSLNQCRIAISEEIMRMVSLYLDGISTFKSIEEIANNSYESL
jgi:hypothetical protein